MELVRQIDECRGKILEQQKAGSNPLKASAGVTADDKRTRTPSPHQRDNAAGMTFKHSNEHDEGVAKLLSLLGGTSGVNNAKTRAKPRLVHDYIWDDPLLIHDKDEIFTITTAGVKLNRRLDKEYFKLSIEQWGYGNAKILQEMIDQKELDTQGILDYLEYTKDINRLFSRYLKGSVLLYDREYREQQFKEKFRWGSARQNILDFQLIPKQNSLTTQVLQAGGSNTSTAPKVSSRERRKGPFNSEGKEICRKFNANSCDFQNCKLLHCCSICYAQSHNATEHSQKK